MSGFKALNIESDDESDIEIDDTKEIQIEDALKLYQNALKFHAEGPESFEKAAVAYRELFESEIFKYPESQPELRRIELYGPMPKGEDVWNDLDTGVVVATAALDTGPSTLPQILHLSHKNYAQFKLEYLSHRIKTLNVGLKQILEEASSALDHFVQALDKDDTDIDLWRRTATVGTILDSKRVARFCLEAVLEGDDEGLNSIFAIPGLDEGLALEQLQDLVTQLQDRLSILQAPLPIGKRRVLSKMLKQRLNSYETITNQEEVTQRQQRTSELSESQPLNLKKPSTWAEFGDIIVQQLTAEQNGTGSSAPAPAIIFDLNKSATPEPEPKKPSASPQPSEDTQPFQMILPSNISEQFPGLDGGLPTVQPRIAPADPQMLSISSNSSNDGEDTKEESPTLTLPSRKRSGDTAGINDGVEEVRTKSRRIRARDSTFDAGETRQAMIEANTRWEYEQQINEVQAADDWVFETVGNLFERAKIVGFEAARDVRQEMRTEPADEPTTRGPNKHLEALKMAREDISAFLNNFSDKTALVLLNEVKKADLMQATQPGGSGKSDKTKKSSNSKAIATPMSDDGIGEFIDRINSGWFKTQDVAWDWLSELLHPKSDEPTSNSYTTYLWPESLKTMVVRVLVNFDMGLYDHAFRTLKTMAQGASPGENITVSTFAVMMESIFELHLDIYTLIKQPNSGVDQETIQSQGDRLQRWAEIARESMHFRSLLKESSKVRDELDLRFFWATTFHIGAISDISQDHVLQCLNDLRTIFEAADEPVITLPNNAIMPELSVAALDNEVSRLTTKDFFLKITSKELGDPVLLIESLEPLLEYLDYLDQNDDSEMTDVQRPSDASPELVRFLQGSEMPIRLLLWQRLREAYSAISYQPMEIFCHLRMMRMTLDELKGTELPEMPQADRQNKILKTLSILQHMTTKVVALVKNCETPLECVDEAGLQLAVNLFGEILQLLQVFNVFEDSVRVGLTQPPSLANGSTSPAFGKVKTMTHDMQVHTWVIIYALLKEAIHQNSDEFATPTEDRFDFLRCVHRNLGIRGICGSSNRMFVRLLKDEFFHMTHVDGYDTEQAQVLYDLYGLNCFLNPSHDLIEHHCTHDAFVDRAVALHTVDLLLAQASKIPIKELIKHPLKDTIEKVHGAVPRKKPSEAILRNREIYRAFMKSPIVPMDIFNCLKGMGNELPIAHIPKSDAVLAYKGWYFLMGHISLTKFRSQKRTAPAPTEDVDIAIAFFNQDLEFSMDNWETWFRLAQAYDTKIEESVVWSAEKLNANMPEVVQLQRTAIHCYIIATALAYRSADLVSDTSDKMTELYTDFANRLYATSRAPFNMLPFALDELEKFMSGSGGITKGKPFMQLRVYTAWKLAKVLYQRALAGNPQSWMLHFSMTKCLWKMHCATEEVRARDQPPSAQQVLDSVIRAIEFLPSKKDSREKREPTLEPHYKLVSLVHKMVTRGDLDLPQAQEAMGNTRFTRNVTFPPDMDEWVPYMLGVLKKLRLADKSHWHHRMIDRAAQIIYADSEAQALDLPGQNLGAMGAKHELTQSMFTKTMVLQVWRPECERAGRHFVYTARYTRFFVQILEQLKDRTSMEMLARRVRRRPHDVFEHSSVWQDICNAYLRLLRTFGSVPEGLETSTFSSIVHDDFLARKDPLEKWMQAQPTGSSPTLDCLREVQELKKVNQSLMKPGPIDDLIGDSYAYLFNTVGKQLWEEERRVKEEEEARKPPTVVSPPRNPMMSLNHLMNLDGANDSAATPPAAAAATEPVAAPRKKVGVGRREIRACAETCTQKASSSSSATTAKTLAAASGTRVEVVINSSRGAPDGDGSANSSAPGSIHDSADDESELSELEEEEEEEENEGAEDGEKDVKEEEEEGDGEGARPMFPGLASSVIESREGSAGFETADEGTAPDEAEDVEMGDAETKPEDDEDEAAPEEEEEVAQEDVVPPSSPPAEEEVAAAEEDKAEK